MAKVELGVKRLCAACGTRYYDFMKSPIVCPNCKATFDPDALLKSRRRAAVAEDKKVKAKKGKKAEVPGLEEVGEIAADEIADIDTPVDADLADDEADLEGDAEIPAERTEDE